MGRRLRTAFTIGSLLLLMLLPAMAQAATSGDYEYTDNGGGTCTITGYTDPGGDVTIPGTLDSLTVTIIGDNVFYDLDTLTSITIPDSVTIIGNYAFYHCSGLTGLTLGNSVTTIGDWAFSNCSSLTGTITIPDSVTSIGYGAFGVCSGLTEVTLGNSVTDIDISAFNNCTSLMDITVDTTNPVYSSIDGVLFNKTQTELVRYPPGKTGSYIIPDIVTAIGGMAFQACTGLTGTLTIPDSVTSIGSSAFGVCSGLTGINIGNAVTTIGDMAFINCSSLTDTLTIPDSVTIIGHHAFYNCTGLTWLDLGSGVTTIGAEAFRYCDGLTGFTIGNSVLSIGNYAFYSCNGLTGKLKIPDSVINVGKMAFRFCTGLTDVIIGSGVATIGERAFELCSDLTGLYFRGDAPSLGDYVFLYDDDATVYYIPGTAGWGATFGGLPTAIWVSPADVDLNYKVDYYDFAALSSQWGQTGCDASNDWCQWADFDQSGEVDPNDLNMLTDDWMFGIVPF